jgi:hypothetical protein
MVIDSVLQHNRAPKQTRGDGGNGGGILADEECQVCGRATGLMDLLNPYDSCAQTLFALSDEKDQRHAVALLLQLQGTATRFSIE